MGVREQRGKFYAALVEELIAFAELEFSRKKPIDGAEAGDHDEAIQRMTKNIPGWKGPTRIVAESLPFPVALEYLWTWFNDLLSGSVSSGMSVPRPTWETVFAWSRLTGNALAPWEAQTLIRLGCVYAQALTPPPPKTSPA